jgi:hypothetical protein
MALEVTPLDSSFLWTTQSNLPEAEDGNKEGLCELHFDFVLFLVFGIE